MNRDMITKELVDKIEADAHGCGYRDIPIMEIPGGGMISKRVYEPTRPLPCIRDEHGEIREQSIKALLGKAQEEFIELVSEIAYVADVGAPANDASIDKAHKHYIAEEAADTITAITTMLEALGIDAEMRDEAQRRVNSRNRARGRL